MMARSAPRVPGTWKAWVNLRCMLISYIWLVLSLKRDGSQCANDRRRRNTLAPAGSAGEIGLCFGRVIPTHKRSCAPIGGAPGTRGLPASCADLERGRHTRGLAASLVRRSVRLAAQESRRCFCAVRASRSGRRRTGFDIQDWFGPALREFLSTPPSPCGAQQPCSQVGL